MGGRPSWDATEAKGRGRQLGQVRWKLNACLDAAKERSLVPLEQSLRKNGLWSEWGMRKPRIKRCGNKQKEDDDFRVTWRPRGRFIHRRERPASSENDRKEILGGEEVEEP